MVLALCMQRRKELTFFWPQFVAPLAGINAVDFWLVRQRKWRVPDFYKGNGESIYWFTAGLNWRAFTAWSMAVWPSFRKLFILYPALSHAHANTAGFIAATGAIEVSMGWERCFSVTWIIGFCGAATVYYGICLVSPPPGKPYEMVYMNDDASSDGPDYAIDEEKRPSASVSSTPGNLH